MAVVGGALLEDRRERAARPAPFTTVRPPLVNVEKLRSSMVTTKDLGG